MNEIVAEAHPIQLVIMAALKAELPLEWLKSRGIACYTVKGLRSGALASHPWGQPGGGAVCVVTGVGKEAALLAAETVVDLIGPKYVLNIGGAAARPGGLEIGCWAMPASIHSSMGGVARLDRRLPVPLPSGFEFFFVDRLFSLEKSYDPSCGLDADLFDMEAYWLASIFQEWGIWFSVLKMVTDYGGREANEGFRSRLPMLRSGVKSLLGCLAGPEGLDFSVVIPVHNRPHRVRKAAESVMRQEMTPLEVVVVDDGSDPPIQIDRDGVVLVRSNRNQGVSWARNAGVQRTRGRWIAFLDSDDVWLPEKMALQARYLSLYPFYQVVQSEEIWYRHGRRVNPCRHHMKHEGWIWEASLERCMISPSSVLIRRELLERAGGFDQRLPACEDYDLWLRISRHHPVGLDKRPGIVKYGGHQDQLSRRYPAMDRFRLFSLCKALASEEEPEFKERLKKAALEKLEILFAGAVKRDNHGVADLLRMLAREVENEILEEPPEWLLNESLFRR